MFSEDFLARIEGEEFFSAQMDGGGDMDNVHRAVASCGGVVIGKGFGKTENGRHVVADEAVDPGRYIGLPRRDHFISFFSAITPALVIGVKSDLKFDSLQKLKLQKRGERKWFGDFPF